MSAHHSPEDLAQFYTWHKSGMTVPEISQHSGHSTSTVAGVLRNIKRYLKGKTKDQSKLSRNYRAAVKLIRKQERLERQEKPPAPRTEAHRSSHAALLAEAYDQFQQAMAHYIQCEVKEQCGAIEAENQRLREEIEQMKKTPKNLNWIDTLVANPEEGKWPTKY